jgi:hypothetical protein
MKKNHRELIYGKCFNELNEEELKHFSQLIETDDNFRKEYYLCKNIVMQIGDKKAHDLRAKLNTIYKQMYSTKKEIKMFRIIKQNWRAVAAAAIVTFLVGAYWFTGLNTKSWNEELYNSYYKADEVFVNTRSKANFNAGVLHYGMELLEKKEYAAALVEFNKLPTSVTANYFAGVANMELNMHEVAIFKFDYVIQDYLNLFYDQAQWYKGLCLVKLEKKKEAIALFEQIGMSESYFKEKAKEIVTDLRKN